MARTQPKSIFGIHSFTPYNKTTGAFLDEVVVLGGSEFALSGETIKLEGGSSKFPYKVADGKISAELNLTVREYPDSFFELLMGKALTVETISGGDISAIEAVNGTSMIDGVNGLGQPTISVATDLRSTKYLLIATGADTATLHAASDIDGVELLDDTNKVADLDFSGVAPVALGIEFTVNGTPAFTIGDTATISVVSNDSTTKKSAVFGGLSDVYPEFGAIVYAQKQGSNELVELDIYSLKAIGMPINMSEGAFSEYSITMTASYDSTKLGVFGLVALD